MKVGIDCYSHHRFFGEVYPGQDEPAQRYSMSGYLDRVKELGCEGVGIESCFLEDFSPDYLGSLRKKLDAYELDRIYAWGHPDGLEAGGNAKAKEEMIQHIDYAVALGAKVMRVVGGSFTFRFQPHEPQLKVLIEWFKQASSVAEKKGLKLAVENHIDYNSEEMRQLIESVGSTHFGLTLDTGNFLRVLDDPLEATQKLAKHVLATHVKDLLPVKGVNVKEWYYFSSVPAGVGLIQIKEIAQVLLDAGYQGMLAFETDMPHPDYRGKEEEMVQESIRYLKQVRATLT